MKVTRKDALKSWLDGLCEQYTVIAPCLVEDVLLYRPIRSSDEVVFDFQRTAMSPKGYFLPSTEVLFEIEKRSNEVTLDEALPQDEQVLFAIRPCDARGLRVLDALLVEHEPADAYYLQRRRKTTLVGLACPRLWPECFCTSVGGAPDDSADVDIMLYEVDGGYLLSEITEKGTALLAGLNAEETDQPAPVSDSSGPSVPVLAPEAWPALFNELYWARLSDRCLSCHACTYVCPTCRCFDVRDYTRAAGPNGIHIERLRSWDSCMAAAYRRIAGGHNPRPSKMHRLRNRYYCKFNYCPQDFGAVACVGCGRCIAVCPVGIDITEMLGDVAALSTCQAGESP